MSKNSFESAVSQIRSAIRRTVNRSKTVSSVDVSSVAPSMKGSERGAAVRTAIDSLVREGFIKPTKDRVYNSDTRHQVTVYRAV